MLDLARCQLLARLRTLENVLILLVELELEISDTVPEPVEVEVLRHHVSSVSVKQPKELRLGNFWCENVRIFKNLE